MLRPLDGYPTSHGSTRFAVFPHAGPALYAQVEIPSPPSVPVSGGDVVEAVECGLKLFDKVVGGLTDSGLYEVKGIPVSRSDFQNGAAQPTYILQWFVVSTGAEVGAETDLSDEIVRLHAYGPK